MIRKLFGAIQAMADGVDHCLLYFSGGRDSIAMLDLAHRFMPCKFTAVFLYIVKGLEFQERTLRYYERKCGIEIKREPHWDVSVYLKQMGQVKKIITCEKHEKYLKRKYNEPWIMLGYRKDESLQRRGHLGSLSKTNYIDWRHHKLFPLSAWLSKDVDAYIKMRKLLLPPEYRYGYRNIDQFKGDAAIYIKNTYPDDWEKIIAKFPLVEAEIVRCEG